MTMIKSMITRKIELTIATIIIKPVITIILAMMIMLTAMITMTVMIRLDSR